MRLFRARVNQSTGVAKHFYGRIDEHGAIHKDIELPMPSWVEIDAADDAFYLLYLREDGSGMTDSWFKTLEDAKTSALAQFSIGESDWFVVPPEQAT